MLVRSFVLLWGPKVIRPIRRTFQNALSRSKLSFTKTEGAFKLKLNIKSLADSP